MLIDEQACSGCGECASYCTVGAIDLRDDGVARVIEDECVDCNACTRAGSAMPLVPWNPYLGTKRKVGGDHGHGYYPVLVQL